MKKTIKVKITWKIPKLGHVVGLKHLTLIGRAITVESEGYSTVFLVLVGKSKTGS